MKQDRRWHYLGLPGSAYPAVVGRWTDATGVYAIRDRDSHEVLYVGSSRGALRKTVTRHLQGWGRQKSFWGGAGFGRQADPGVIYDRDGVEVRVWFVVDAATAERRLIKALKPRDNQLLTPPSDGFGLPDLPF